MTLLRSVANELRSHEGNIREHCMNRERRGPALQGAFWLLGLLSCAILCPQPTRGQTQASTDEVLLRSIGLTPDGPALLEFLRVRALGTASSAKLAELIGKLGAPT